MAGLITGQWLLVSLASPESLDQQFVGGFLKRRREGSCPPQLHCS